MKTCRNKFIQRFYLLLFFLCFLFPAYGAVDTALYQGEVPVASYLPADWQKAVVVALQQVLAKVSNNPNITQNPTAKEAIAKPNAFVQSYNYVAASAEKHLMLQVRFSPKAIDRVLQNSNQSNISENTAASTMAVTSTLTTSTPSTFTPDTVSQSTNIVVSGVYNLQDYTAVIDYLRHIEGVVEVNSKQTQGSRILLVLKMHKTTDELEQAIALDNKLIKSNSTVSGVLMYRWVTTGSVTTPSAIKSAKNEPILVSTPNSKQSAVQTSSAVAPIVEGVPVPLGTDAVSPSDSGQAQSFAVPDSGATF